MTTNTPAIEYLIWGIPPQGEMEVLLHSTCRTLDGAKRTMEALADEYGCTAMRIQAFDPTVPPDFSDRKLLNV